MKAVVAAFNQEKALVGAFSVITNLRMELFEALHITDRGRTWEDPDVEAGDCEQGEGEEEGGGPGEHQEAAQRAVQGRVGLHRGEVLAPQATAGSITCFMWYTVC